MKIISGKTGSPHVTSQQFRQIMEGIIGDESYIIAGGENLEPELVSNNALKIRSGMLCHHGNVSCVDTGTYDEVELENGSQGMKRIDLVVNRYTRNEETGIESCDWVVLKGTPAESSPTVPEYTVGNLQNGDLVDDCPVFKVELDGIQVTGVMKMLSVLGSDLSDVSALKSKMSALGDYTPMLPLRGYSGNMNNMPTGTFLCELAKCTNAPSYPMGMWAHVICYAGFSQTAIFYNGTSYPPVIATRTYANNAWTAWAEQAQGFDFASVRFNGIIDNALRVDLTNPYADVNKPRYVDRAKNTAGMPTDCQWGIREVCQITNNWVMVRITGWTTNSHQAIWTNVYVSSKWYGWTKFEQNVSPIRSNNVPRFYAFTQTPKTSGANSTSVALFNDSKVNSWLGVSDSNGSNTAVFISNGDGKASGVHFTGATHQSPTWYATFQTGIATSGSTVRVNGMIVYFGNQ